MKRYQTAVMFAAMFLMLAGSSTPLWSKGTPGVEGTITEIDERYFLMNHGSFAMKVFVSGNTKFKLHGQPSDATHVKVGAKVAVVGTSTTGGRVTEATQVDVLTEAASAPVEKEK